MIYRCVVACQSSSDAMSGTAVVAHRPRVLRPMQASIFVRKHSQEENQ
jgi:hypothetical protein